MVMWVMNDEMVSTTIWKEVVVTQFFLERLRKTKKSSVKINVATAQIRTEHLPNINLKPTCYFIYIKSQSVVFIWVSEKKTILACMSPAK
jgi:hypothetical protein